MANYYGKKGVKKKLPEAPDVSSRASCIAVGCYSGSDNGHCGRHMHSPIKMVSRV